MPYGSIGRSRKIASQHFVAFYHPTDGRILHLHAVHTLEGGREVTRAEAEEEAVTRAKQYGVDVAHCKKLYATHLPEGGHHRVDVANEMFVGVNKSEVQDRMRR